MKTGRKLILALILLLSYSFSNLFSQEVFVKDILNNPSAFDGEVVDVTGLVIQYIEATEKSTAHYLLKDDYGAVIRINTAEGEPETNVKFNARGIVYVDKLTNEPFISEKSRIKINQDQGETIVIQPKTWLEENILLFIIIGSAVILLLLVIILFSKRNAKSPSPESIKKSHVTPQKVSSGKVENNATPKEDLKTMVIPKTSAKTMKFIPGELEVLTGQDKGKVFKIAGYPTEEGSVVTIGREKVMGPRDYAHIELKERTISRKQAEVIFKDGKLYIKNLSETNFSKLNGKDIPTNSLQELNSDSVITFGEVEMKYKV